MPPKPEPSAKAPAPTRRARGLFLAALALFLLWVAALVVLAIVSGHRPMDRAGTEPMTITPEIEHAEQTAAE